jgi:soluble lytic murein transglycosylase-like protein
MALGAGVLVWIAFLIAEENRRLETANDGLAGRFASAAADRRTSRRIVWIPASAVVIALCSIVAGAASTSRTQPPSAAAEALAAAPAWYTALRREALRSAELALSAPPSPATGWWYSSEECDPLPLHYARALASRPAVEQGLSIGLVLAVMFRESRFYPCAVSVSGAQGLMQLKPGTAAGEGVSDPFDPEDNVRGGVRYLSRMIERYNGNLFFALSAYKEGPNAVNPRAGQLPTGDTEQYVRDILDLAESLDD